MSYILKTYLLLTVTLLSIAACAPKRNLVYFSDLSHNPRSNAKGFYDDTENNEPRIQENDVLNITVSSLSTESNAILNNYNPYNDNRLKEGYRVDKNGFISFPVLNQVKLGGLTIQEAQVKLVSDLEGYVKKPITNIAFMNFKVTVLGEVNKPGSFNVSDDKINLLEAIGLAGDMTPFGKRDNVLIIRHVSGKKILTRVNMNNSDVLNSPFYNLKQNDVIYVEPDKSKEQQTNQNNRYIPIAAASFSVLAVIVSIFLKR